MRLAKSRRPLPHDADAEFERVIADRPDGRRILSDAAEDSIDKARWDRAVKAAMKEDRRGRPPPAPELPGWPRSMHVEGVVAAVGRKRARIMFPEPYRVQEREWQTEVWSGSTLIATVQYSRMAILSKRDQDLRASLLAAKASWGTVQVIGNPKFKKRMTALAAELGVPISNPELADTMAIARKPQDRLSPAAHPAVAVAQSDVVPAEIPQRVVANSDDAIAQATGGGTRNISAAPDRAAQAKLRDIGTQAEASPTPGSSAFPLSEEQISAPKPVPIERFKASPAFNTSAQPWRGVMLIESAEENNWEVTTSRRADVVIMSLKPSTMSGFGITEEDLAGPAMQTRLKVLHDRQQLDHAEILELVSSGLGTVTPIPSPSGKVPHRMRMETNNRRLLDLKSRCQHHDALHHLLHKLHERQLYEREETERKRRLERARRMVSTPATPLVEALGEKVEQNDAGRDLAGASREGVISKSNSPAAVPPSSGATLAPSPGPQGVQNEHPDRADQNQAIGSAELANSSEPSEASSFERSDENQGQVLSGAAYIAAYAAALADIGRPRVLGEKAKIESPVTEKPVAEAVSPGPANGTSHPVPQEPTKHRADVDPDQEAAKAAWALGKGI
jgi:hypothetical protein